MTTVSAEARLMPRPPALVDNRKQKSWRKRKKKKKTSHVQVQSEHTTFTHIVQKSRELRKYLRTFGIEMIQRLLPHLTLDGSIQPLQDNTTHQPNVPTVYRDCEVHFSSTVRQSRSTLLTWNKNWRLFRYSARMSSIRTIWEKMSTRWPRSFSRTRSLSRSTSFPLLRIKCYREHEIKIFLLLLFSPLTLLVKYLSSGQNIEC